VSPLPLICRLLLLLLATLAGASLSEAAPRRVLAIHTEAPGAGTAWIDQIRQRLATNPPPGAEVQLLVLNWPLEGTTSAEMTQAVLQHLPLDVVVGTDEDVAVALRSLAPQLPVVFDAYQDPRRSCAVELLDRPGGNATGTFAIAEAGGKMAELLLQAYPAVKHVVVLLDEEERGQQPCPHAFPPQPPGVRCQPGWVTETALLHRLIAVEQFSGVAQSPAIDIRYLRICQASDLAAWASATPARNTGLVVPMRDSFYYQADALVQHINRLQWPAIFPGTRFTKRGGLMALSPLVEASTLAASQWNLVRQILMGRPAGSLPVEQPRAQELIFNRATARQKNLVPSHGFLRRVDRFVDTPEGATPPPAAPAAAGR